MVLEDVEEEMAVVEVMKSIVMKGGLFQPALHVPPSG